MDSSPIGSLASAAVFIAASTALLAADTGDFDGDGRLSIRDVVHFQEGLPSAPCAMSGFEAHPCFRAWRADRIEAFDFFPSIVSGIVYLESLRRAVPDGMPHWVQLWSEERRPEALAPDPRVLLSFDAVPVARLGSGRVRLDLSFWDFYELDERYAVIEAYPGNDPEGTYPGASLRQIAVLEVRVREGFSGGEVEVRAARVPAAQTYWDLDAESGAILHWSPDLLTMFSPATSVRGARISIRAVRFLRGDANGDGKMDLSDAVATLVFLFNGGDLLACVDAADVDDNGRVEITDPVVLLGALFLGARPPAPPYPECGRDPTSDALSCGELACRER